MATATESQGNLGSSGSQDALAARDGRRRGVPGGSAGAVPSARTASRCPMHAGAAPQAPRRPYEISDEEARDVERIKDPYPSIERMRGVCPVAHQQLAESYTLLNYEDIRLLLKDPTASRDPRDGSPGSYMYELNANTPGLDANMLFVDGPRHARLRGLVSKAFTPRAIERMRPRIEARAEKLLDAVAGQQRVDLMEAFAMPFPTIVIAELLGVAPEDQERFKDWSLKLVRLLDPLVTPEDKAEALAAREEFGAYLQEQISARRALPRDDLFSALIQASEGDDQLSDLEVVATCRLLLAAGNITTTDLIGNAVKALLDHPEQLALLRAEPARIEQAVEEALRWDPPVVSSARIPLQDRVVAGCRIPKGATVQVSLAAANRDPALHEDADRFDITRQDTHHVSFGGGVHFCLGAHLARLEAQVALCALIRRFPRLRLAQDGSAERDTLPGFRGHRVLEVEVD